MVSSVTTLSTLEKTAPIVAVIVAGALAILKFIVGFFSWSVALLSSAIDSLADIAISVFNFFALRFASLEPDEDHNYWHWKIEWIAAVIEWPVIALSGAYIVYEAIKKVLNPLPITSINLSLVVMIISVIVTWLLVLYLTFVYKKTKNLIIKADTLHYKVDLFTNAIIFITLGIIYFFPWLVIIDWLMWLAIWLYIIYEAIKLVKEWTWLLLDKALPESSKIKKTLDEFVNKKVIKSYHCLKTRLGGNKYKFAEFHIVLDPNMSILKAHNIWEKIEREIKKLDPNAIWYITWHVDPFDDSKPNKSF